MTCTLAPRASHDELRFGLMEAGLRMWNSREDSEQLLQNRERLVDYCVTELVAHLDRDETWLRAAQRCPDGHLLAEAMSVESRMMKAAVSALATAPDACQAMAQTRLLHTFLAAHDHHEKLLRLAGSTA